LTPASIPIPPPHEPISGVRALPASDPSIALWMCQLDRTAAGIAAIEHWLSPTEHARAARFGTDALRRRWIAGRATLRLLLASALGIDPAAVPLQRGIRGRPELADPHTRISTCRIRGIQP
jgi:4'-phosphopantetheinyl transferase